MRLPEWRVPLERPIRDGEKLSLAADGKWKPVRHSNIPLAFQFRSG
jgi:hypothetical protein